MQISSSAFQCLLLQVMSSSLSSLNEEEAAQTKRNADLEACIVSLKKELLSQQEKLDRATRQVKHFAVV